MPTRVSHALALTVSLAVASALVACGSPSSGAAPSGSSSTSAHASGSITWYSSHNPQQNDATVAAFQELYPDVEVEVLRLVTGELAVRYAQERESGSSLADVITLTDPEFIANGEADGWWETDVPVDSGWPSDAVSNGVARTGILALILGYNTDSVDPGDVPSTWEDLLDPRFRDRIMIGDLRGVPSYLALAELWSNEYGDDFLTDLTAQNPRWVAGMVPGNESLGSGAADLLIPNARPAATTLIDAGAPIELVELAPTTGSEYYTAVPSDAPDDDLARLFFEFLTTVEGQNAFNGTVGASPRDDTTTHPLPEYYVPLDELLPAAREREAELLSLVGLQ